MRFLIRNAIFAKFRKLSPALLVLLSFSDARAYTTEQLLANRLDPTENYSTLATPHFQIHYPERLKPAAARISVIAEKAYEKVTKELFIASVEQTNIVLADKSDDANVFTMVYPHRQIFFDIGQPQTAKGINDYADLHDWIITHEFTHIAQLEMRRGIYRPLGWLFGSWIRPHLTAPIWEKEGIAVYLESKLTPKGRGNGTEYPMMMRTAVQEGLLGDSEFGRKDTIFTLDNKEWPWGVRPYLFGYYLINTMAKHGKTAIAKLLRSQAGSFPYSVNGGIRDAGILGFDELWDETLRDIRERSNQELARIRKIPVTPLEYLSHIGQLLYGLQISPDGKSLYVTRDHPDFENSILEFKRSGDSWAEPKPVIQRSNGYQISVSKSGRFIAFDQTLQSKRHYAFSDIYLYDLKKKEVASSTGNLRARDPDIHPDGEHLVYVQNENGKNRLIMNDTSWQKPVDILGEVGYSRLSGPRFSPEGKRVVLSVHNSSNGGEDLWLVNLDSGRTEVLIANGSQNSFPTWAPDGNRIVFSSNYGGVSNIYAIDLSLKKIQRLSNVEGGLFYPVIDPLGKWIYAVSYHGTGYDIVRFRSPVALETPLGRGRGPATAARYPERPSLAETIPTVAPDGISPYSGARHLAPQFLMPSFVFRPGDSQVGLSLGAIDPLFFQTYNLSVRYDGRFKTPVGSFYYFNGTHSRALDLSVARDVNAISGTSTPYKSLTAEIGIHVPLSEYDDHLYLHPFVAYQASSFVGELRAVGFGSELRYDTTLKQIGYSFPETGSRMTIADRQLFSVSGGDTKPNSATASFATHYGLPWPRHALHLTVEGGTFLSGGGNGDYFFTLGGIPSFPYNPNSGYTIYGAKNDAFATSKLLLETGQYTFSIWDIERGLGTYPVYLGRLSGGVRAQAAQLPRGTLDDSGVPWSLGLELYQSFVFGTLFEMTAQAGFYHGSKSIGGQNLGLFQLTLEN